MIVQKIRGLEGLFSLLFFEVSFSIETNGNEDISYMILSIFPSYYWIHVDFEK